MDINLKMNDFTKEELSSILDAFHYARDSACWTKYHEETQLITKIQSMIDNYCEHEETISDSAMVSICKKCNRTL